MLYSLSIVKTPAAARKLFAAALWKVSTKEKTLYLTFDDGPINEVTPFVLDELKKYNAKATFFCIGKNIAENPQVFKRILEEGHLVANHTQNHLNGWLTENNTYFKNIGQCAKMLNMAVAEVAAEYSNYKSITEAVNYFRPPYGKLSITQYNYLKKQYKIVMWDVLTFDFDLKVTKQQVLNNVLENAVAGSVIVFHDSIKAADKMLFALPKVLEHYTKMGYKFDTLPE